MSDETPKPEGGPSGNGSSIPSAADPSFVEDLIDQLARDANVTVRQERPRPDDSGLGRRTTVRLAPSDDEEMSEGEKIAETLANVVVEVSRWSDRFEGLLSRVERLEGGLQEVRIEQGKILRDIGSLFRDQGGIQRAQGAMVTEMRENSRRITALTTERVELGKEQESLKAHLVALQGEVAALQSAEKAPKQPLGEGEDSDGIPPSPEPKGPDSEAEETPGADGLAPPLRRHRSPSRPRSFDEEEERRRRRKLPDGGLPWTFSGDPTELEEFQVKVRNYMPDYRWCFANERDMVRFIGLSLTGDAGKWFTSALQEEEECLETLYDFMVALNREFADPLLRDQVEDDLVALQQGRKSVREYTAAFRTLISQVPKWEEEKKVKMYAAGLNKDLLKAVGIRPPKTLTEWYSTAYEAERAMRSWGEGPKPPRQSGQRSREGGGASSTQPSRPSDAVRAERMAKGLCLKCGKAGHLAAQCTETSKKSAEAGGGQKKKTPGDGKASSGPKKKLGAMAIFTQPGAAGEDAADARTTDDEEAENFNDSTQ